MRNILFWSGIFGIGLFFHVQASPGQGSQKPEMTEVEATILGPDAKPLANRTVEFSDAGRRPSVDELLGAVQVSTDIHGVARFQWPIGVSQMQVRAKAVGYGMSGLLEFVPGIVTKVVMPPLAPYGSISGQIPKELLSKAKQVRLSIGTDDQPVYVNPDKSGEFQFVDVKAGECWLRVLDAAGHYLWAGSDLVEFTMVLNPGVHKKKVEFPLATEVEAGTNDKPTAIGGRDPDQNKQLTLARGAVLDEQGKPIAGATVYAVVVYNIGHQMIESAAKTVTDDQGHYIISITVEGWRMSLSGLLVAYKEGCVPAIDRFSPPDSDYLPGKPSTIKPPDEINLALSSVGGMLDIQVIEEGKPAAGVVVDIRNESANLHGLWGEPTHDLRPEMMGFLHPKTTTNERGEAHFQTLAPGNYTVTVTGLMRKPFMEKPSVIHHGIIVRTGQKQTHRIPLFEQPGLISFNLRKSNGQPLYGNIPIEWDLLPRDGRGRVTTIKVAENGDINHIFERSGLFWVESRYRRSPTSSIPLIMPYDSAEGTLAVSAAMQGTATPVFTARHYEPGSAEIQVKDVHGQPIRAVVEVRQGSSISAIGSTDGKGILRLEGVQEWPHLKIYARPIGVDDSLARPLKADKTNDAALRGRMFFPSQSGLIKAGEIRKVVMQQAPAGYIRGKLKPPPGDKEQEYHVWVGEGDWEVYYDPKTGEFLVGPFEEGKTAIGMARQGYYPASQQEVTVVEGDVVHVDLLPTPNQTKPQPLQGQVLLADGKTPAYGAIVQYLQPHEYRAVMQGEVDVHGIIRQQNGIVWTMPDKRGPEPSGTPSEPVVVALLPGRCGAVIAPPSKEGQKLSLVLPPAISLHGKVTIGGKPADQQAGTVRVYAAYQGKGTLNYALSLDVTAQADGSFELAGMTPGRYRVQAALDGIWLSTTQTIEVTQQSPADMGLEIGAPGAPVRVKVLDAKGAPAIGNEVIVDRPAGPLTEALWPHAFYTDGAGLAWIPTLESGIHVLRAGDKGQQIIVPALPAKEAVEVVFR
jgi:protocatechuate 3,4-dioxygenase beta subunit